MRRVREGRWREPQGATGLEINTGFLGYVTEADEGNIWVEVSMPTVSSTSGCCDVTLSCQGIDEFFHAL